jgi:putative salt-induced outer membrane protein
MHYFRWGMILIFLGMITPAVSAETQPVSDVAELSYVDTGGNSDLKSLVINNALKYPVTEQVIVDWKINTLFGETNGIKSAERYFTELRGGYPWTNRLYSFVQTSWTRDTFAGLDARYIFGIGAGYKLVIGPPQMLQAEAGLNYSVEDRTDGTSSTFPGGRAFGQYGYLFNEKNKFTQSVEWLSDFKDTGNYNINAETALISALNTFLSLKSGYVVKYDHEPAAGTKKTDTLLGITLVMNLI